MTRHDAVAAVTALTAVAGIVAALAAPVQAQSDEQSSGYIIARRIDTYLIEVGWQTPSGARIFPVVRDDRARYFEAGLLVDYWSEWHRSFPITVGGTEIGHIDARIVSGRRIEFVFTPTDGERILPPKRYFPMDTRIGRWLRSSEITIGSASPRYTTISAGASHTCAIRTSGAIECWGQNDYGQTDAPDGSFSAVSVALLGGQFTCAIRTSSGAIVCWGTNGYPFIDEEAKEWRINETGQIDAPAGSFTGVSAGRYHACGLRTSGEITCWGNNSRGQADAPEGSFTAVGAGIGYACALRENSAIVCWGSKDGQGQYLGQSDPPPGSFTAVSAGFLHACAIRESGAIECWGDSSRRQADAPAGSFTVVSAGFLHTCAIRESGAIECWGDNRNGQADAPPGSYIAVSAGSEHTCGLRENNAIVCWGLNNAGQTNSPPN